MITRNQSVKLSIAVVFGIAALTTVALSLARTPLALARPSKAKLLRRKDDLKRLPDAKERDKLRGQNPDKADKRELKLPGFKEMPLKIQAPRHVDSATWYKDLEIE